MSYRTANLQMLHFIYIIQQIYVQNILNMLHTLRLFLFKMPFISKCYLFWFLFYSHFIYRVCLNKKKSGAKGLMNMVSHGSHEYFNRL